MNVASDEPAAEPISTLLVEDDAPTLWRLQDALGKAGYQVKAAATLGEARAALAGGAPRVLLTDLQLPDGHGVDLIRETRRRFHIWVSRGQPAGQCRCSGNMERRS